jgi:type I restriction enzyme S subunit
MKAGWQTKKLGDLLEVQNGYAFSSKEYSESGYFVMRIGNVQNGYISCSHPKYINLPSNSILQKLVLSEGDILVSLTGNVGRVGVIEKAHLPAVLNQRVARLTINNSSSAIREFILFFLYSDWFREELTGAGQGAAQQNVSTKDLVEIRLPVPPLPEQQRLVAILDEAFDGIATAKANVEKNLQNARALFESHLQAVFNERSEGWVERRLEQIGVTQTGSTPEISDKSNYGDFVPFIKPADFNKDGSLNYDNDGLSQLGLQKARRIKAGSVLMVCIGATIGKCGFCDRDVTTNQQVNSVTPFKDIFHKYVFYQMSSEDFQRRVLRSSSQATLPIINKSKWSALTIALPPDVEQQKSIAAKLDELNTETQRFEDVYWRKIAALDELKKSLLHQAFSGEL